MESTIMGKVGDDEVKSAAKKASASLGPYFNSDLNRAQRIN